MRDCVDSGYVYGGVVVVDAASTARHGMGTAGMMMADLVFGIAMTVVVFFVAVPLIGYMVVTDLREWRKRRDGR